MDREFDARVETLIRRYRRGGLGPGPAWSRAVRTVDAEMPFPTEDTPYRVWDGIDSHDAMIDPEGNTWPLLYDVAGHVADCLLAGSGWEAPVAAVVGGLTARERSAVLTAAAELLPAYQRIEAAG